MICPQCGKHYAENETVCRLCTVPLRAPFRAVVPDEEPDFVRPSSIDQTLDSILQDIKAIDRPSPPRPAGFFIRGLAFTIDSILLGLLTLVLTVVAFVMLERSGTNISREPEELMRWLWLLFVLPNTALTCLYFSYFHAVTGQTVGKLVCGLHVVTSAGWSPLGWGRSIVRCIGYFLSSFFYLGFLWVLFNRRKRGWHDYMAGSVVVYGPVNEGD
jgi:uncharacterized RDD family membrane protein YckC